MKAKFVVLAAVGALTAGAVFAATGPDVLKSSGCTSCHEADKKKVGPSYKDIAAKHKDDKDAQAKLVAKIKDGKGHPKGKGSDADLSAAVKEILSAK